MATWVLGDVHGCFDTLRALLPKLALGSGDRLWLVGDVANRGPHSLETLRWAQETAEKMGDHFRCVLGNHDLHLLRRAEGLRPAKSRDTLDRILEAPDGPELVEWVAGLPLLHRERIETAEGRSEVLMVHAGLWPEWTPEEAERRARAAEPLLRDPATRREVLDLEGIEARPPGTAERRDADTPLAATRLALYGFSELRTLRPDGSPDDDFSDHPDDAPPDRTPWYRWPERGSRGALVLFGHWSSLGFHRGDGVLGLDTGAVWGGGLTAVRLEDGERVFQPTLELPSTLPSRDG